MLSVAEARARILSKLKITGAESVPISGAHNRVLFEDVSAAHDLPLFDNSSMDGFAIRSLDSSNASPASPLTLSVVADLPAGSTLAINLAEKQAARIMTGAQIPTDADAVIPVEDTDHAQLSAGEVMPKSFTFARVVKTDENIRKRGSDIKAGELVLNKGRLLKPQDAGLLAMLGFANVNVHKKPRIALISSGDELLAAGEPLSAGKIYDSNSYVLAALMEAEHVEVLRLGVARDTRESVTALLENAFAQRPDLILSSAGVSVGAYDFIKEALEAQGALDFWKVNMRPGKPLAFGEYRGIPFIGLPGNPVSAFVGFQVFVRPALQALSGCSDGTQPVVRVRCAEEIKSDSRESYLRVKLNRQEGVLSASLTGNQSSGNLLSLVQADALLIIPAGVKCVPAGQDAEAILL